MNEFATVAVPMLGRALLHFIWQGGLIGLLAACALLGMRRARPQARYALACGALLACVLAPLADIAWQMHESKPAAALAHDVAFAPTLIAGSPQQVFPQTTSGVGIDAWLPVVVAMWAAGACVFCLRMVLGLVWIERLRRRPQPHLQAMWQARLDALAAKFEPGRRVMLCLVDGMRSPASAGWFRPVVLLPTALALRMPPDLVEALLAHELAHVRRYDYLVNVLQGVVEALLFFHPVVWWLSRRVRDEREHIADQLAAHALGSPRRLATALAELSEFDPAGAPPPRFAPAAQGGVLMARIEQLIRPDRVVGGRIAFPLLGVAAACLAFYAHAQMAPKAASLATLPAAMGAVVAVPKPTPLPQPAPRADAVLSMPVLAGSAVAADAADEARMRSAMYTVVDAAATAEAARDAAAAAKAGLNAEASASARAMAVADAEAHGAAVVRRGDGNAYALVRRGSKGMTMSGSTRDIRDVEALRSQINGDFLWVRRGGKAYTITDPAFLARVSDAWTDSEALGKQMDALGREMDVHGQRMNVLGAQMNALSVHHGPTPAMQKSQQRIRELAAQQGALARRQARLGVSMASQDEVAREHTEAEMDKLSAQMDALGEQIDRESDRISDEAEKMTRNAEPMEALGRQMEDAAKPMEALGKRMEALGERQEQLARVAERKVEGAIDEALQRGLARPIEAN